MSFSIVSITFLVGLALIVIALLGGGFEAKEIRLPVLGIFPRLLSFATGTSLLLISVFRPDILPRDGQVLTPTSQDPAPTQDPTPTPTLAPTATLSASPTSINAGQSSTLTWSSTNATGCSGTNFTPSSTSGSMPVTPPATTIYSITCAGAGGASRAASATVTVTAPPNPNPDKGETETLWRQNDSIMSLLLEGDNVEIRYVDPTDFIKSTGVVSGDLKFEGKRVKIITEEMDTYILNIARRGSPTK